jgi:hypothetical protein
LNLRQIIPFRKMLKSVVNWHWLEE